VFGIFDLTFPKIVDPTIFVRESFIFAGNFLTRRAGAFFSRAIPSPVARSFAAIDLRDQLDAAAARGLRRLPHGREPQQDDGIVVQERHGEDAAMDLLASRRCKKRRRRWISSSLREERRWRAKKGGGARGKEKSRARGGLISRETTATWGVRARQGVQDSRDIKIAKPLCICKKCQVWSIKCQVCQNA